MNASPSIPRIMRDAAGVIRRDLCVYAILIAIGAAPGVFGAVFLAPVDQRVTTFIGSLVVLYLQLFATCRALDLLGTMPVDYRRPAATEGRFPSAFLASLLSTVAIALGLVVFVVPGILLLVFWAVWMPVLAAERLRATSALRRSWQLTRPWLGTVLLLVLVVAGLYVAVAAAAMVTSLVLGEAGAGVTDLIVELLVTTVMIATPILWAATYGALRIAAADDPARPG